jgi:hypothetical protein
LSSRSMRAGSPLMVHFMYSLSGAVME